MVEGNTRRFYRREIEEVQQVSQNDEDFLLLLYEEYADPVYYYFCNQFRDCSGAEKVRRVEELTQETFMRITEVLGQRLSPWGNRPFSLWLYSVMRSVLREHVAQHSQEVSVRTDDLPMCSQQGDQKESTLWDLVRELSAPEQQILILLHAWKLSYNDLTIYLKRDEAFCRELHTRALKNLQQLVRKTGMRIFEAGQAPGEREKNRRESNLYGPPG